SGKASGSRGRKVSWADLAAECLPHLENAKSRILFGLRLTKLSSWSAPCRNCARRSASSFCTIHPFQKRCRARPRRSSRSWEHRGWLKLWTGTALIWSCTATLITASSTGRRRLGLRCTMSRSLCCSRRSRRRHIGYSSCEGWLRTGQLDGERQQVLEKMAEASGGRTHRRRGDPPPAGFEDRDDHRTACASVTVELHHRSAGNRCQT